MLTRKWLILIVCTSFIVFSASTVLSQDTKGKDQGQAFTGQAFYGKMVAPNSNVDLLGDDYEINFFGAAGQSALGGETIKYGLEAGGLFSVDSSVRQLAASSGGGGGTVAVSVDINSLMIDFFGGGFASFEPSELIRFSAGAGPLLIYASRETEPEVTVPEQVTAQSNSGFGVGLYARAGFDLFLTKEFGLHVGARRTATTLSFEDSTGKISIEGWQYYAGLAFRF